jgi:hypothetical protein
MILMKTALLSLLTATLLGFAAIASGRQFDAADFFSIAFTAGLVAWTVNQYSRELRPLTTARPIRLPISPAAARLVKPAARLAA